MRILFFHFWAIPLYYAVSEKACLLLPVSFLSLPCLLPAALPVSAALQVSPGFTIFHRFSFAVLRLSVTSEDFHFHECELDEWKPEWFQHLCAFIFTQPGSSRTYPPILRHRRQASAAAARLTILPPIWVFTFFQRFSRRDKNQILYKPNIIFQFFKWIIWNN